MLSKEQKIRLILDIKAGKIPKKALPIFKQPHFYCICENERCINEVYFDEVEFQEITTYLENNGLMLWVQNTNTMKIIDKLISN